MFAVPTAFQRNRDIEDKAKLEGSMAAMKEAQNYYSRGELKT